MSAPLISIEPAGADEPEEHEGFTIRDAVISFLTAVVACAIAFGIVLMLGTAFLVSVVVGVP